MDIPDILGQENVTKYAKWRAGADVNGDGCLRRRGCGVGRPAAVRLGERQVGASGAVSGAGERCQVWATKMQNVCPDGSA